jgi:hypothetical protein
MKNKMERIKQIQFAGDRLGRFSTGGITKRHDERDWVLIRALSLQERGQTEEAKEVFRELIKYHAEPAGPYGTDLFLYDPTSVGIRYALVIAKVANLENEVVKDLTQKLEKALERENWVKEDINPDEIWRYKTGNRYGQ